MNVIMEYLIVIVAIFSFALASSVTRKGFSSNIFIVAVIIGINVLVWKNVLPFWTVILCALLMVGILFGDNRSDDNDE